MSSVLEDCGISEKIRVEARQLFLLFALHISEANHDAQ